MITSPGTGDGKTAVTLGLSRALARLDHRVLVIETDPRTSILSGHPTRPMAPGLSGVVAGTSILADEVVDLEELLKDEVAIAGRGISLLPAGPEELTDDRLFAHPDVARAIAASRDVADFVLVTGPPTHRLHEALALVDAVDAALIVAKLRWTTTEALHRGVETMRRLSMTVLGLVLTDTRGRSLPARSTSDAEAALIPLEVTDRRPGTRRAARGRHAARG
jgi:Mrp family chromosome partitioning ATPase